MPLQAFFKGTDPFKIPAKRTRGIYVYDRGGDRNGLFRLFMDRKPRFIVRLVGSRNLVWRKKEVLCEKLASKCRMLHGTHVAFFSHGKEHRVPIWIGAPDRPRRGGPARL